MMDDLWKLDAMAQAELVARGEVTALELVDAAIARIERVEPELNALTTVDFERARERARTKPAGALSGVPFVLKDLSAYPGMKHAMGCRLFAQNIAREHTPYTAALDAAGLIVLGKTATSEMGLLGSTETMQQGVTHNPWDRARSAGGSSGGAAAAVASRMVPLAHASDGGGSIRIPASMNGVFGFKPGRGRVLPSTPDDMRGLLIDHCVSWSVRDSALLLSLTERKEQDVEPVGFVAGPSRTRLRIGVYTQTLMGREPAAEQLSALEETMALCRQLGHEVIEVSAPPIDGAAVSRAFFTVAGMAIEQLAQMMEPMLGRALGASDLEPFTLALLDWYRAMPSDALGDAIAVFDRSAVEMADYLGRYDVTLCPTVPVELFELGTLAPELDRAELIARTEQLAGYTPIHNIAGVPAMSVPLSMSRQGWPIGSHFAAARGREATLLSLAYELEDAAPWRDRCPPIVASAPASGGARLHQRRNLPPERRWASISSSSRAPETTTCGSGTKSNDSSRRS